MMPSLPTIKIAVLKKTFDRALADEYCQPGTGPCPLFEEGQEFLVTENERRPEGFCDWAWNDINKVYLLLRQGGGFGGIMKDNRSFVRCCTGGIRPVMFLLERIEE
jgi:uncharacterized repeat protein (TIGR04076 family)